MMNYHQQHNFLEKCLAGNKPAIALCECLFAISQVWDDLIDNDTRVGPQEINDVLWLSLVDLPSNPFYRKHFTYLNPIVQMSIMDWHSANMLENGSEHDKSISFVLRDSLVTIVIACVSIIRGHRYVVDNGADIRRFFHDESLTEYLKGVKQ